MKGLSGLFSRLGRRIFTLLPLKATSDLFVTYPQTMAWVTNIQQCTSSYIDPGNVQIGLGMRAHKDQYKPSFHLGHWLPTSRNVPISQMWEASLAWFLCRGNNFVSSQGCVLNLKSSLQLNPTEATAVMGIPSQYRGLCYSVEFPNVRCKWTTELIGLWALGELHHHDISSNELVLGKASARRGQLSYVRSWFQKAWFFPQTL